MLRILTWWRRFRHWCVHPYHQHLEYGDVIEADTWVRKDGTIGGVLIVNGRRRPDLDFHPKELLPKGPLLRL